MVNCTSNWLYNNATLYMNGLTLYVFNKNSYLCRTVWTNKTITSRQWFDDKQNTFVPFIIKQEWKIWVHFQLTYQLIFIKCKLGMIQTIYKHALQVRRIWHCIEPSFHEEQHIHNCDHIHFCWLWLQSYWLWHNQIFMPQSVCI